SVAFFFQAEDGIRDFHVTGVQTCALPICGVEALCVDGNDDGPGSTIGQSAVTFTAAPSTTYLIRVLGFGGDQGSVEIGATSAPEIGRASCRERGEVTAGGEA